MGILYISQPPHLRLPLPPKESPIPIYSRLFSFDPSPLYDRIDHDNLLNPFKRSYPTIGLPYLFPNPEPSICACGCLKPLPKRHYRWHSHNCSNFAYLVFCIINSRQDTIKSILKHYIGHDDCAHCGVPQITDLDHIHPVKHGGAGAWLSNYQFLCKACHIPKTKAQHKSPIYINPFI